MLTLKVIITDIDGQSQTYLFNGDSISHKEYFSEDHYIVTKQCEKNSSTWIIGSIIETSSTQKFTVSEVEIYDEDRFNKNKLFIVPRAECYIMDNGKTIDTFGCYFE